MELSTVSTFKRINAEQSGLHELTSEELHALQKVLFEMLVDIDGFCRINSISYTLGGGSLLGAVRHGGFIPWDDDVDINFPRDDYEKFRRLFPQQMGDKYWLHTPEDTHNYGLCIARVRKKGTTFRGREDIFNEECGVFVDIFIVENISDNKLIYNLHGFLSLAAGFFLSCRMFNQYRELYKKLSVDSSTRRTFVLKLAIGKVLSIFPVDFWTHLWNNINRLHKDNKSKYVTIPVGVKHFFGETYFRAKTCTMKDIPFTFEGKTVLFKCMVDTDYYLTKRYGDYMTPPEDADKEKHIVLELDLNEL